MISKKLHDKLQEMMIRRKNKNKQEPNGWARQLEALEKDLLLIGEILLKLPQDEENIENNN